MSRSYEFYYFMVNKLDHEYISNVLYDCNARQGFLMDAKVYFAGTVTPELRQRYGLDTTTGSFYMDAKRYVSNRADESAKWAKNRYFTAKRSRKLAFKYYLKSKRPQWLEKFTARRRIGV